MSSKWHGDKSQDAIDPGMRDHRVFGLEHPKDAVQHHRRGDHQVGDDRPCQAVASSTGMPHRGPGAPRIHFLPGTSTFSGKLPEHPGGSHIDSLTGQVVGQSLWCPARRCRPHDCPTP